MAAVRNVNIICTIHQPSAHIFSMFSSLILLRAGRIVYHGPPLQSLDFFEARGYPCPPLTNPADHIMDTVQEIPLNELLENINDDATQQPELEIVEGLDIKPRPRTQGWFHQFYILLCRNFKETINSWGALLVQWGVALLMSVFMGFYLYSMGEKYAPGALQTHVRLLFYCSIATGVFSALSIINTFPTERILMLKERNSGLYCSSAYTLARIACDLTKTILNPFLYASVFYYLVPLNKGVDRFFIFIGFLLLTQWCAMSLALATSAICRTTELSVIVLPLILEFCRLCSGFYNPPAFQLAFWEWFDAISYLFYSNMALVQNDLKGLYLTAKEGTEPINAYTFVIDNGYDLFTLPELAGSGNIKRK